MNFLLTKFHTQRNCLPACTLLRRLIAEQVDTNEISDKLKISVNKVKSLAVSTDANLASDSLLGELQDRVREGLISVSDLLSGAEKGHLTQNDLYFLFSNGALSSSAFRHIQTQLHGGRSQLSLTEVIDLLTNRLLGKDDLVRILRNGHMSSEDLRYLVKKGKLPEDVLQAVLDDINKEDLTEKTGFSEIMKELELHSALPGRLEKTLLSGELHPNDLELLVSENLLSQTSAEKMLENCSESIVAAYEEAEKFTEFVKKGRFSFEELEVMRAKGVLGESLIHYLTMREAIDDERGQRLLEIDEDHGYFDPEESEDNDSDTEQQTFVQDGESDEGFYPKNIPESDILGLWEQLMAKYTNRPGRDEYFEIYQDSTRVNESEKKKRSNTSSFQVENKVDKPMLETYSHAKAIGKRKTSIAEVQLSQGQGQGHGHGHGQIIINGNTLQEYFPNLDARCYVISPFVATNSLGEYNVKINVEGGGWSGKAQAIRHGIAKALIHLDPSFTPSLKELGLLTRDARVVERKKPGKAKARKSFQWVKR